METPKLYAHQERTAQFLLDNPRALVWSDPGTGKTASVLTAIQRRGRETGGRALVIAPKAILVSSWLNDARKFTPNLTVAIANANNREKAFSFGTDIVVTNHDAVKKLAQNPDWLKGFNTLVIDESTAFKHHTSQRSKAIAKLRTMFEFRIGMTGTPRSNSLLDLWHQVFLIDDGERLGTRYYAFRAATHEPIPITHVIQEWVEKEGAQEAVADLLSDITIRYRLEDCIDMPEQVYTTIEFELPKALRDAYKEMAKKALLQLNSGDITAVHQASVRTKLLQIASGSVYDGAGNAHRIANERYDLVAELCAQREHSVVAYIWTHQRDQIIAALERAGINRYAVLDGSPSDIDHLVQQFQKGEYQVVLAHPKSASHGLTLTRATTTIWPAPIDNTELFQQFNRRIYRTGQTKRTEVIMIQAKDTIEEQTYARNQGKIDDEAALLALMETLQAAA